MIEILGVFFDNFISDWRTSMEKIDYNVLVVVVQGTVQYSINGENLIAKKGDMLYIPAFTMRAGENHVSGPHQKYSVVFELDKKHAHTHSFPIGQDFHHLKIKSFEYMKHRFEQLYTDIRGNKKHRDFICHGMLQEIIGLFGSELESPVTAPNKVKYAEVIEKFLLENYRKTVEIEQLAKLIHRSPGYTISIFKEVMGQSPIRYIHQLRIMEACNLLLNTEMTVVAISEYLGYYDTSYFSRMFKKITSMSPKEFMLTGQQVDLKTY